ncbi:MULTISPECIES: hypothetical protein [Methylomonas]|uniref:Uncharacterized protein n=2 Tax=Methylomonas TaxID=416 RepID=A0A126T3T5_9GAMM|nr:MULTISPECIES: hypothetical protein [Methylomonas]AMK76755.1 hypothetical protein JT25_009670 [Methylomonas denitrificans]OAI00005.1 hypothetical protein A1342_18415 [Methylomonas methanica]TCV82750.1 hypothetical protein EDE11_1115 [Methylomonas methanica]
MPAQSQLSAADLRPHWLICAAMLLTVLGYNLVCHLWASELQIDLDEAQRVLIRSVLYGLAILLFPFTKLLRHILLRLNQTMPGPKTARQRYLSTIIITQALIELVSLSGLAMFILGDGFNTLYIFSVMGVLGIFLHKPNPGEYLAIAAALSMENR